MQGMWISHPGMFETKVVCCLCAKKKVVNAYTLACVYPYVRFRNDRYREIPPVSRLYLTGAFLTTLACAFDLVSPFSLYFNWELVFGKGQIWRLLTSYLFFGVFSFDFLFHMYFLVRLNYPLCVCVCLCRFMLFPSPYIYLSYSYTDINKTGPI
jgi:hypothetical protein